MTTYFIYINFSEALLDLTWGILFVLGVSLANIVYDVHCVNEHEQVCPIGDILLCLFVVHVLLLSWSACMYSLFFLINLFSMLACVVCLTCYILLYLVGI